MCKGAMLADVVAIIGTMDVVFGAWGRAGWGCVVGVGVLLRRVLRGEWARGGARWCSRPCVQQAGL